MFSSAANTDVGTSVTSIERAFLFKVLNKIPLGILQLGYFT